MHGHYGSTAPVHDIARMMLKDCLPKRSGVNVGIYLGGRYALMAEQCLYETQVCPSLKQGRSKRMAERMRTDCLRYPSLHSLPLQHYEYHSAGEMPAAAVQKHIVLLTRLYVKHVSVGIPKFKFVKSPS